MAGNLNLEMRLTANTSQLTTALNSAGNHVKTFANNANSYAAKMTGGFKKVYEQLNGFSMISKLAVAAGGYSILSQALARNLEFEKTLLEMKQLANMTAAQAAEMRASAIAQSSNLLVTPQEIAEGMKVLANASMKFEAISGTITEAGRAALLFRSSISEVANMDFDIQAKFNIDPSEMKKAHEILYFHSKDGRFEAKSLSHYAPVYMNELNKVGIGGMGGLNFAGALTQAIQQAAPATEPGEVATMIKQGFSHTFSEHLGKKLLKETGIDVQKYAPHGKFYGKNGVDGVMDLALAMKAAGLDDQFKLQKAGFREQQSANFWLQFMNLAAGMKEKLKNAEGEAGAMVGDRDVQEIKDSKYAQFKQWEITQAKGQVSDGATNAVGKAAAVTGWAAEHPMTALAGAVAGAIGGRLLWKKMTGGGGGALEKAIGGLGGAGMPVTVTNWPAGMGGPIKASERLSSLPGRAAGAAEGAAAGGAATAVRAGLVMAAELAPLLLLGGDSAQGETKDRATLMRDMDLKMQKQGMKRQEGWLFDSYVPDNALKSKPAQKTPDQAQALNQNSKRWKTEIEQLDRMMATAKTASDKELLARLDKQRTDLIAKLDGVIQELRNVNSRPVQVSLDSRPLVDAVNTANGRDARRQ